MDDAYAHCERLVEAADKDRFLATLFAPGELRPHLHALYAFNVEISRVREAAHNTLPGEMRIQWWRDVLSGRGYGDFKSNPVATPLLDTVAKFQLPPAPLLDLLEARSFDLYNDPMPNMAEFEFYARWTSSSLIELAAAVLAGGPNPVLIEPARHAGMVYAIAGLVRALPIHAVRRQLYLPLDLLERHNVDRDEIFAIKTSPALRAALAEIREVALAHLAELRAMIHTIPTAAGPAFLPVVLAKPVLARMARWNYDPFRQAQLSQWRKQLLLWRATWGGILAI
jgi:15-cis-phytoene synthase